MRIPSRRKDVLSRGREHPLLRMEAGQACCSTFFLFQASEQFFPLRGKLAEVGFQNDVRRDAWVGYSMQPGEFLFEVQDGA